MPKKNRTESIEAKAFRHGTQRVPLNDTLNEINAAFEERRENESRAAANQIKKFEADTNTLNDRKADANERWQLMNTLTAGRHPEFFKPLLAVGVAFSLIGADGQLLAPVMDGLNITQPIAQLVVSIVLVTAFSVLLKIAVHNYRQAQRKLWLVIAPASFSLIALAIFGWWRGTEVVFASLQSSDSANTFAADNPTLTKLFITLATIALPVGAAVALEYGLEKLRFASEWRKARTDFQKYSKRLDRAQKKIEAATAVRDHEREKLAQTRDAWLHAARQAHTEGQRVGAHREPLGRVLFKIITVSMLIVALMLITAYVVLDTWLGGFITNHLARLTLYLLAAFGLAGWYAARQWRRWDRPTAEELYDRRKTHFDNVSPSGSAPFTRTPSHNNNGNEAYEKTNQLWLPATDLSADPHETKVSARANS